MLNKAFPWAAGVAFAAALSPAAASAAEPDEDFAPVSDATQTRRLAVTALAPADGQDDVRASAADRDRLVIGRLAHRLFQFCKGGAPDDASLRDRARRLLDDEDRDGADDPERVVDTAVDVYQRLRGREDVRHVLEGSACLYEVPFSMRVDADSPSADRLGPGVAGSAPVLVRGVIDCLALAPSGDVVVLDFKTGAPRDSDREQMAVYLAATRHLFPGRTVEGRLVYATASSP